MKIFRYYVVVALVVFGLVVTACAAPPKSGPAPQQPGRCARRKVGSWSCLRYFCAAPPLMVARHHVGCGQIIDSTL